MSTVVLIGTLDTKGEELAFVRDCLAQFDCEVILVDGGVMDHPPVGDGEVISADTVAEAGGGNRHLLAAAGDRSAAMAVMREGVRSVVLDLHGAGRLDGVLAIGGSGGAALAAAAMQALPVGVPKLIVSTMAAGDTRPYVGESDIAMLYPVVDIAGLNRLSRRVLENAAAAMASMAAVEEHERARAVGSTDDERPLIGATMFGVTTPCVTAARERLEALGYEVLVFHATGTGGRALEGLVRSGFLAGVLDATTTELADELVGGVLSAGPDRLTAAGGLGIPQVVSVGALDMVNFGPPDTVPARFRDRRLYEHNASVTLLRTSVDECRELGRILAAKLNAATGPTSLFLPRGGVSMIDVPGAAFHDPAADAALFDALLADLDPHIEVVDLPVDINDPTFGPAMADRLDELVRASRPAASGAGAAP